MAGQSPNTTANLTALNLPPEVTAVLERLRDDLTQAAGGNLAGLILYGGLARGRYRPGKSDVNVVLLLHDTSGEALTAIAPALRTAWRAAQVEPFILKPAEVERLARVFPAKLLDIQAHHIALAGEDPFAGLEVAREPLRLHLEQSLRNLALRLRRRYVAVFDDPAALAQALANITIPLKVDLTGLLRLAQKGEPAEATSAAVFAAAAAAFSLDGAALARLAALRQQTQLPDDLPGLYQSVAATVAQAAEVADRLKESQ